MKTIKEVAKLTGLSIRTLRYYDEIGLLKPTACTEAGYRLYDDEALKKLQEIMFFRELDFSLTDIKYIMENPGYDKEQAMLAQKSMLERKRNRLNGIIELITDVMKGVNTMSFGEFNNDEIQQMVDHTLACMSKESLEEQLRQYGGTEQYKAHLASGFSNEQATADLLKWYGSKEKVVEAVLQATGDPKDLKQEQDKNAEIYYLFMAAKDAGDTKLAQSAVKKLAENYKAMFALDNAKNILLDLAKEYLQNGKLTEATDNQFGKGCAEYVAHAILQYYGA